MNKKKKETNNKKSLTSSYGKEIRFCSLFVILFLLMLSLYYWASHKKPFVLNHLSTRACAGVISIITPDEKPSIRNTTVESNGFELNINWGCEGVEGILIVTAAILAFPMEIKAKLFGVVFGSLVVFAANTLRLVSLYYTLKYKPALLEVMHVFIGQTFIILVGIIFFALWVSLVSKSNAKTKQQAEE